MQPLQDQVKRTDITVGAKLQKDKQSALQVFEWQVWFVDSLGPSFPYRFLCPGLPSYQFQESCVTNGNGSWQLLTLQQPLGNPPKYLLPACSYFQNCNVQYQVANAVYVTLVLGSLARAGRSRDTPGRKQSPSYLLEEMWMGWAQPASHARAMMLNNCASTESRTRQDGTAGKKHLAHTLGRAF